MKSLGLFFSFLFFSLGIKAGISVVMDDIRDGGKINAPISFDPPVSKGEIFNFYVDNKWTAKLEVLDDDEIYSLKLKFRSKSNAGKVYLTVKRNNGEIDSISLPFRNINPYSTIESTNKNNKEVELRQKFTEGKYETNSYKFFAKNEMTINNYISNFDIDTNNGRIKFHLSPNISKDPYIVLEGTFSEAIAKNVMVKSNFDERYLSTPEKTISKKNSASTVDIIETLKELDSLLENQLITKKEFENLKNDLLK